MGKKASLTVKAVIVFIVFTSIYAILSFNISLPAYFFRACGYALLSIFIVIALTAASKVKAKSKINEMLYYSFILLLIQSITMMLSTLDIYPQFLLLFNTFYIIGYLFFVAALYFLFKGVFIQKSNVKTKIVSAFIITLLLIAFIFYAQPLMLSNASALNKAYALTSALVDIIVTTGLIVLMIFINSKLFIKTYKWALLAISLALARDFIMIPSRLLETTYTWNLTKLLAFIFAMLAYISITRFLEQQDQSAAFYLF